MFEYIWYEHVCIYIVICTYISRHICIDTNLICVHVWIYFLYTYIYMYIYI